MIRRILQKDSRASQIVTRWGFDFIGSVNRIVIINGKILKFGRKTSKTLDWKKNSIKK